MNIEIYFAGLALLWAIALSVSLLLWAFRIRRYITDNGRCRGDGPNFGWAILADASIASEIARSNKVYPIFLRVFWIAEFLIWSLPVIAIVALSIR